MAKQPKPIEEQLRDLVAQAAAKSTNYQIAKAAGWINPRTNIPHSASVSRFLAGPKEGRLKSIRLATAEELARAVGYRLALVKVEE